MFYMLKLVGNCIVSKTVLKLWMIDLAILHSEIFMTLSTV